MILKNNFESITTNIGRLYKIDNDLFPSITTVLSKTTYLPWLEKWKERVGEEEALRVSKAATDRGTIVHEYLEKYWNNEDISSLQQESSDVIHMTNNLINTTKASVTKVYCQEIVVYDKQLKIAGRLDKAGEWNNIPAIIDYKTSKKLKKISDIKDYFIQASFYARSYNQMFGTNINKLVILITVENDKVQTFEGNLLHHEPDLIFRAKKFYQAPEVLEEIKNAAR